MVELAVATSIPPSVWAEQDDAAILTAMVVLAEQYEAVKRGR